MATKKDLIGESSSLSTLGHSSEHPESTKKAISTEDIQLQSMPSALERQSSHYHIYLPFQIRIKSLVRHLRLKLEEKEINILYCDDNLGQILVQKNPQTNGLACLLDCLCIFRKQGWPKGSMFQTGETVSLTIKRHYIDQKCVLGVRANFTRSKSSSNLNNFIEQLLEEVKRLLESYNGIAEKNEITELNSESPLALEMVATRKVSELFWEEKGDLRFKSVCEAALGRINTELTFMEKSEDNKKLRVSDIIEKTIKESDTLLNFLMMLSQQQNLGLHSQYTLYAIENLFCYHYFGRIFEIYRKQMAANCQQFRKNSEYINKNLTNRQYFDYLEVRPKFRLPNAEEPYDLAIDALRGLETALTLREILLCVQETFSLIKVCCLYEHNGKLEIASMDDVLPVMIYVVAKAQVENFPVFVKIIDDYVRLRGVFQLEERVTTTLYVATQDITKKLPNIPEK